MSRLHELNWRFDELNWKFFKNHSVLTEMIKVLQEYRHVFNSKMSKMDKFQLYYFRKNYMDNVTTLTNLLGGNSKYLVIFYEDIK